MTALQLSCGYPLLVIRKAVKALGVSTGQWSLSALRFPTDYSNVCFIHLLPAVYPCPICSTPVEPVTTLMLPSPRLDLISLYDVEPSISMDCDTRCNRTVNYLDDLAKCGVMSCRVTELTLRLWIDLYSVLLSGSRLAMYK